MAETIIRTIIVKTEFEGFHRWKDAPPEAAFLRDYHRHRFVVEVHLIVDHADRQMEFFLVKARLDDYLKRWAGWGNRFDLSCEALAEGILRTFDAKMVKVSEDGENAGASFRDDRPASPAEKVWEDTYARPVDPLLPSMKKRTNCFVGTECEGPFAGQKTLFVPGCVSLERFEKTVNKLCAEDPGGLTSLRSIRRVYLGAGNDPLTGMTDACPALFVLEKLLTPAYRFTRPLTLEVKSAGDIQQGWAGLFGVAARHPDVTLLTHRWQDLWEWGWAGPMFAKDVRGNFVRWYERGSRVHHGTDLTHQEYAKDTEIAV